MSPTNNAIAGKQRVLVVDDSRAMQAIIRRVLQSDALKHAEVETVASGEAALEALERGTPQLIVSDWHMPSMSGIELLQTVRQLGHSELAMGFVTTETSPALLEQARTNGASFIIQKPFKDRDLVAAVSNVLLLAQAGPAAAAAAPEPLSGVRALRRFVQAWMPGVPFRIIEGETFNPGHLSPQNLLTVYSPSAGGSLCAVAAANMPALCMLGGGAIQADPKDIRRAIQDNNPGPEMIDSAMAFFREMAAHLHSQVGVEDASFKGANLVASDFGRLRAALTSTQPRADYRLSVPGYGDGRLVFIRA